MILTTHAVVGVALASGSQSPALAFSIGLLSHYLFDAIPHWHYPVPEFKSKKHLKINKALIKDLLKIGMDFLLAGALVLLLFSSSKIILFFAFVGAVLPDFLSGIQKLIPTKLGALHTKFHHWIHSKTDIDGYHLIGPLAQFALILISTTLA